eukprot:scaffold2036_cov115-Isochrysis_galbana.AAC.4
MMHATHPLCAFDPGGPIYAIPPHFAVRGHTDAYISRGFSLHAQDQTKQCAVCPLSASSSRSLCCRVCSSSSPEHQAHLEVRSNRLVIAV